jgi:hypothetical protein
MRYVRVWHAGGPLQKNRTADGVGLFGVGSATTIEHCEVAFAADDGFLFNGGTVNVKHLSVLFVGDEAFEVDKGYQGKGQFLFAMVGRSGGQGAKVDSDSGGDEIDHNAQPRSHPQWYSMTILGGGHAGRGDALMNVKGGAGGKFGNSVLAYAPHVGLLNQMCGSELRTQTMPEMHVSIGVTWDPISGYLYFAPNNIVWGAATPVNTTLCTDAGFDVTTDDPSFRSVSEDCLDYTCMPLDQSFSPLPDKNGASCNPVLFEVMSLDSFTNNGVAHDADSGAFEFTATDGHTTGTYASLLRPAPRSVKGPRLAGHLGGRTISHARTPLSSRTYPHAGERRFYHPL